MNPKKILLYLGIIFAGVVISFFALNSYIYNQKQGNPINTDNINSFEDCAKYFPVMESYPRQCNAGDKHFVEEIETNFTASFEIYTNGTKRVFTNAMYHNLSEEVYISENDPNIINVKFPNITWGQFFETLPFTLTENCLNTGDGDTFCTGQTGTLTFTLNDQPVSGILDQFIKPNDKLVVSFN